MMSMVHDSESAFLIVDYFICEIIPSSMEQCPQCHNHGNLKDNHLPLVLAFGTIP